MEKRAILEPVALSDDFLEQYKDKEPDWGFNGLGYIVYLRTYARTKEGGTLEKWWETVRRVTEGNFNIEAERLCKLGKFTTLREEKLRMEMERFYHLVFNLIMTPPGRGLWMSGTEYEKRSGDSLNNCWGVSMKPQQYFPGSGPYKVSFAPCFTFDQAMKGGGVGINIQKKYVNEIPDVRNTLTLKMVCSATHQDFRKMKKHGVEADFDSSKDFGKVREFYLVDDSREGWVECLRKVIDAHFEGLTELVLDFSEIRPSGSLIKGFGGIASGPEPLVKLLAKASEILNKNVGKKLSSTEWGDIIQNVGNCVVAGNVRRTALILIGDIKDKEFIESKNYTLPKNKTASQWRWSSNNSVDIDRFTEKKYFKEIATHIYYNGEPGYVNIELARNFGRIVDGFMKDIDAKVEVFNPCGEVPLPNGGACNLFEINLPKVHTVQQSGAEHEALYREVCYLAARYVYRVTFRNYEWETTRQLMEQERRLGVGITGITDWALILTEGGRIVEGYDDSDEPIYNPIITAQLDRLYQFIKIANEQQAMELESVLSIKVTTVKPSGTVSLLMGVSPGQHYHWSRYMIRRVRISSDSALIPVLEECGYNVEDAISGFKEGGEPTYDERMNVISFPIKAPTADCENFVSASEISLEDQFALQALLQKYWADNSVSATLTFHQPKPKPVYFKDGSQLLDKMGFPKLEIDPKEENAVIQKISNLLFRYKDKIKSTTLLPHNNTSFPQMPYEEIDRETYEKMVAQIQNKPWEVVSEMRAEETDDLENMECSAGACPIK